MGRKKKKPKVDVSGAGFSGGGFDGSGGFGSQMAELLKAQGLITADQMPSVDRSNERRPDRPSSDEHSIDWPSSDRSADRSGGGRPGGGRPGGGRPGGGRPNSARPNSARPSSPRPSSPAPSPRPAPEVIDTGATLADQKKVVLRRTSKGRAGKSVTLVQGLVGMPLKPLAKQIRSAMGCGSSVEDDAIVVQGDQRDRLATWLTEQGVKQVVKS